MKYPKIFCAVKLSQEEKDILRQNINNNCIYFQDEISEDLLDYFFECEICFGNVPRSWIEQTERLRWLQLESVGFESYIGLCKQKEILITNLKDFFAIPVAESAIAGLLCLYRGINRLVSFKEQKYWVGSDMRSSLRTLNGKQAIILGAGSIGMHIKKLLNSFNCNVKLFDKFNLLADYHHKESLYTAIPDSDIIIGCLPQTSETIGFLDQYIFEKVQPHAIIINVGRGSLLDEDILIEKLNNGNIAGAVLDVTYREPLPPEHKLWSCPNTILTQHTAGGFDNELIGKIKLFCLNYQNYIDGKELINLVKDED